MIRIAALLALAACGDGAARSPDAMPSLAAPQPSCTLSITSYTPGATNVLVLGHDCSPITDPLGNVGAPRVIWYAVDADGEMVSGGGAICAPHYSDSGVSMYGDFTWPYTEIRARIENAGPSGGRFNTWVDCEMSQ